MDAGSLVPDEVTIDMVRDRLAEPDAGDGFLLDGFPRTVPQASALDKLLADLGTALDLVMELVVDDDEVIRRLSGRRTCRGCGKIWHVECDPTSKDNICDRCGRSCSSGTTTRPRRSPTASWSTRRRPRHWSTSSALRASWWA